jgi:two-component system chemotaxis response regulator CheB
MTTNVFIVDDSATARTALKLILETSDDINVQGVASNPLIALKRMNMLQQWPDVIISDIEMPEMDGIAFLEYLKRNRPTPFIVFSNHTGASATTSIEALFKGAVDIIPKPNFSNSESLEETSIHILNAVRAAAKLNLSSSVAAATVPVPPSTSSFTVTGTFQAIRSDTPPEPQPAMEPFPLRRKSFSLIAIGSSTGGTTIIEKILRSMREDCPGIVIVQHMPELFTHAFAKRINQFCRIIVKEAEDGDVVKPGLALIAPGGLQMRLVRDRLSGFSVNVFDGEHVNRHKPSVDVLFSSVADIARSDVLGVILTGMGKDGAKGMQRMKEAGAETIAQSEEDCAVYGMPKAAVALGAVDHEMQSSTIAAALGQLRAHG